VEIGGASDADDLYIAPTILSGVARDSAVMQKEIFGPLLPVLDFDEVADVLKWTREQPSPLAVYLFTNDQRIEERVLAESRSGAVCVNDVVLQMIGTDLPFGGVGESGMGRYHGRAGFEEFSYARTIVRRRLWPDFKFRYPPQRLSFKALKQSLRFLLHG
jgi:acyl-CoA reductase-like NAD-dependent aldehyde dehydrogenase